MTSKQVDHCTPEELRALADKMEQESQPIKVATLKHDLYDFHAQYAGTNRAYYIEDVEDWYFTEEVKKQLVQDFLDKFEIMAHKGVRFVCYCIDGEETWFDDENIGIENMSSEWAEKNLENFVLVQPKKSRKKSKT